MEKEITVALIGLAGTVLGAVATPIVTSLLEKSKSSRMREQSSIAQIVNTKWDASWFRADGTLFARDVVTFEKWTKGSRFVGYGEVTWQNTQYKYSIEGEVSPNRIIALTYKAERYPTEANIGIACLELSTNAQLLEGYWLHMSETAHAVVPGRVAMTRIR